jgi:aspartate--ammonia ligase
MSAPSTGTDMRADLAGPGVGNYEDLEKVLPDDYASALDPRETQATTYAVKEYIEKKNKNKNIFVIE